MYSKPGQPNSFEEAKQQIKYFCMWNHQLFQALNSKEKQACFSEVIGQQLITATKDTGIAEVNRAIKIFGIGLPSCNSNVPITKLIRRYNIYLVC